MSSDRLENKPQLMPPERIATPASYDTLQRRSSETLEPPVVATLMAMPQVTSQLGENTAHGPIGHSPLAIPVGSSAVAVEAGECDPLASCQRDLYAPNSDEAVPIATPVATLSSKSWFVKLIRFPFWFAGSCLDLLSLLVLLSIVSAIPVLQLASLGYLLTAGGRLATGKPWRTCLPGLRLAGKLGVYGLWAGSLFVIVLQIQDLAHSAQLLQPDSSTAVAWRIGAVVVAMAWLVHSGWAAIRGGRWWHFLWPAPIKFLCTIWRPQTWSQASDRLYDLVTRLQLPKLWWLGARATLGVLAWLIFPATMMIIGQRAPTNIAPVIGLVGAGIMIWAMYYLPFLEILFVKTGKLSTFLAIGEVRRNYAYAPWAHFLGLLVLSAFAIPLYLLRIEDPPQELMWTLSLIFAILILPSKLVLGWAVGYADKRQSRGLKKRSWYVRWSAYLSSLVPIGFYVGALYLAQLVAKLGAVVMYFQHAFLVPSPF